jgi:hypothetical protein
VIVMPAMPDTQEQVWRSLLQLAAILPRGWTVVGGQMVHLHCAEREREPHRTTTDADAVVDIRADRGMLSRFTGALRGLGFTSAGSSADGHEHRWGNGEAIIDVLVATHLGRSQAVTGVTGSTTVGAPGAQQALDRSEPVKVRVGDVTGTVFRPNLVGALVMKGAAVSVPSSDYARHKADFALLATMIRPRDDFSALTKRDRQHLTNGIQQVGASAEAHLVPAWDLGLATLIVAMDAGRIRTPMTSPERPESWSPGSRRSRTTPGSAAG